ncbi:MAG: glycosyltransferase family 2 protein [Pseudonocardiales bacterium]
MSTDSRPAVAVVVVTYNSAEVLQDCLLSMVDGFRGVHLAQVLVADNASADGSMTIAEAMTGLPVRVVQLGRNAGYAAAINAAVRELDCATLDAVLVLNPDTRLAPGAVSVLAGALRMPRRGIAVPRLVNPDGSLQPSLRRPPTVTRALVEAVVGGHRSGRFGELITDPAHYRRPGPAVWATGAAMLISTAAISDIGPWDESFLLYGEEVEYALRAADRGWVLWYEPDAIVEHICGEFGTNMNPMLAALLTVNRVRLFRKRHGALPGMAYFAVTALGAIVRAMAGRQAARAAAGALLRPSRRLRELPA